MMWMVEQQWKLMEGVVTPIRSVVECETEEEAKAGAEEAVKAAVIHLAGELVGEPLGKPVVLYPVG